MRKKEYHYACFKCGEMFWSEVALFTDRPTCDKCFKKLLKIKDHKKYLEFIA